MGWRDTGPGKPAGDEQNNSAQRSQDRMAGGSSSPGRTRSSPKQSSGLGGRIGLGLLKDWGWESGRNRVSWHGMRSHRKNEIKRGRWVSRPETEREARDF